MYLCMYIYVCMYDKYGCSESAFNTLYIEIKCIR